MNRRRLIGTLNCALDDCQVFKLRDKMIGAFCEYILCSVPDIDNGLERFRCMHISHYW